ncbi:MULTISPECIES: ANTAR domain-containing protein [Dehalobacter]|uniref:ANTAR domain-containing protein n=1 Tax=Dehalobacter restrictus TaxID=55583 RepID=A0A857DGP9_9FIRM|nr:MULTISPECIES: ANTAR domain-containing protein [Dehalobacter]MCG1026195.1 ANTAR domain-containing protein [Dehalobacter sp.]MDJ0304602.1 ANTAR domain-containing protein [Dehalobacter sp.]OCZ53246.1 response regulator receiver protein [Dehalobacter sp. TeCB1]QHA00484.1 ANTAR domain-containing protein [Dehalobacter restrictus]
MKRAILISQEKQINELNAILPLANYQAIARTDSGIEALRIAQRVEPDLIICGGDIHGISPLDLVQNLVHANICPVIFVLDQKDYVNLDFALKTNVHHIMTAPLRAIDVVSGIAQAEHRFNREIELRKEMNKLNDELKTRKLVYQAILILIAAGTDEETAYASIRTEAMTSRKTIRAIAAEVVKGTWRP